MSINQAFCIVWSYPLALFLMRFMRDKDRRCRATQKISTITPSNPFFFEWFHVRGVLLLLSESCAVKIALKSVYFKKVLNKINLSQNLQKLLSQFALVRKSSFCKFWDELICSSQKRTLLKVFFEIII